MPLNAIPALFGCYACCWKTAYAHGCQGHVWTLRTCVTFGGCVTGKYSAEAGTENCTACEAGEEQCCGRSVI